MKPDYDIKYLDQPAWDVIGGGLSDFNKQQAGDDEGKNLCFVLQSPSGEIVGGVIERLPIGIGYTST